MKKIILASAAILFTACFGVCQNTVTRTIKMPTEQSYAGSDKDYATFKSGFFAAGELTGGYSLNAHRTNFGHTEVDFVGGYRLSEFFRGGIGIGARVYFHETSIRKMNHKWGLPLFLNLRGNFIPNGYRDVVPFWSFDIGTTFPDGFMIRPNIGLRIGQPRSAFIISVGYMGQHVRVETNTPSFYSSVCMKLGYEF